MSLVELALNNVRKNLSSYLLFIFSQLFTTVIFYTFISLIMSENIQAAISDGLIFYVSLAIASAILVIFVVLFNGYTTAVMNQKRKKEIGIYTLLGIEKKQIARLLALETLVLGGLSLIIGLIIGVVSSKLLIHLFLIITRIELDAPFHISGWSILITSALFSLLMVLNVISNYLTVYKNTLITLIKAPQKAQTIGNERGFWGILGIILTIIAYIQLLATHSPLNIFNLIGIDGSTPVGSFMIGTLLIIGTFLIIRAFLPFIIKRLAANKTIYYNSNNMVTLANIRFNLKSQINMMSLVTLLITATLLAVSFSSTLYLSVNKSATNLLPVSYQLTNSNPKFKEKILEKIGTEKINFHQDIRTRVDGPDGNIEYLSLSSYNDLLRKEGQPPWTKSLGEDEMYAIIPNDYTKKKEIQLAFEQSINKELLGASTIKDYSKQKIIHSSNFLIVVNDQKFSKLANLEEKTYTLIDLKKKQDNITLAQQLKQLANQDQEYVNSAINKKSPAGNMNFTSAVLVSYESATVSGLFLFVALFVSIVFIFATGAILYFKQSNEAYSQVSQFDLMKKIGMNLKQIKQVIAKQMQIVFFIPLIMGILHCVLMIIANYQTSGTEISLYWPLIVVISLYTIVFIIYYTITLKHYQKIVLNENKN